jgi:hypothetical protein
MPDRGQCRSSGLLLAMGRVLELSDMRDLPLLAQAAVLLLVEET